MLPSQPLKFHKAYFRGFPARPLSYALRTLPWGVPISTLSIHRRFFEYGGTDVSVFWILNFDSLNSFHVLRLALKLF